MNTNNQTPPELKQRFEDLTPYEKFTGFLDGLKDILHPNISENLTILANRYVDSERQRIKDEMIAPELQEMEKHLLQYRKLSQDAAKGQGPGSSMELKFITEKIKDLYGK